MNANTLQSSRQPTERRTAARRIDAQFIEEHQLVERYLAHKLPSGGARALENWCRENPGYLDALKLGERAQATLKLLEFAGRPVDLCDPKPRWWRSVHVLIGLTAIAVVSLAAFWAQGGRLALLRGELDDARIRVEQGSLVQPAIMTDLRVSPDRGPGIDRAQIAVSRNVPQLVDLHLDLRYSPATQFRLIVDKKNQGRALILNNLLKDSNGELRLTFNTSGLAAGIYNARVESLPLHGSPTTVGWLLLDVH